MMRDYSNELAAWVGVADALVRETYQQQVIEADEPVARAALEGAAMQALLPLVHEFARGLHGLAVERDRAAAATATAEVEGRREALREELHETSRQLQEALARQQQAERCMREAEEAATAASRIQQLVRDEVAARDDLAADAATAFMHVLRERCDAAVAQCHDLHQAKVAAVAQHEAQCVVMTQEMEARQRSLERTEEEARERVAVLSAILARRGAECVELIDLLEQGPDGLRSGDPSPGMLLLVDKVGSPPGAALAAPDWQLNLADLQRRLADAFTVVAREVRERLQVKESLQADIAHLQGEVEAAARELRDLREQQRDAGGSAWSEAAGRSWDHTAAPYDVRQALDDHPASLGPLPPGSAVAAGVDAARTRPRLVPPTRAASGDALRPFQLTAARGCADGRASSAGGNWSIADSTEARLDPRGPVAYDAAPTAAGGPWPRPSPAAPYAEADPNPLPPPERDGRPTSRALHYTPRKPGANAPHHGHPAQHPLYQQRRSASTLTTSASSAAVDAGGNARRFTEAAPSWRERMMRVRGELQSLRSDLGERPRLRPLADHGLVPWSPSKSFSSPQGSTPSA